MFVYGWIIITPSEMVALRAIFRRQQVRRVLTGFAAIAFLLHVIVSFSDRASCVLRGITTTGAFCYDAAWPYVGGNELWCKPLAEALSILFARRSVLDLGGGLGRYTRYFRERRPRLVREARCFDGAPRVELATGGLCRYMDLARPQAALARAPADWVLSLEVGEHVPARFTAPFLDNLHHANRQGIILSWAVPGQGGYHHTHELANRDVVALVESRGYRRDLALTKFLRGRAVGWASCRWFRNSLLAFRRANRTSQGSDGDHWAKFFSS